MDSGHPVGKAGANPPVQQAPGYFSFRYRPDLSLSLTLSLCLSANELLYVGLMETRAASFKLYILLYVLCRLIYCV